MGLREVMQSNQPVIAVVAVVVIIGSVMWMSKSDGRGSLPSQVYFYDLGTGELFPGARRDRSPITAPSGEAKGVKAIVYACGQCSASTQKIAYLTKFTPEALDAMKRMEADENLVGDPEINKAVEEGTVVASVPKDGGEPQWIVGSSDAGMKITDIGRDVCGNEKVKACYP